ncbi:hypothetical protein [Bradyrhizobium sp. RDM4]|uniref:hypothetical protein n=1 Tax=Bradyrhizobium sp. RDM4 TaxID=3378765 RepID=UPI0038FC090A
MVSDAMVKASMISPRPQSNASASGFRNTPSEMKEMGITDTATPMVAHATTAMARNELGLLNMREFLWSGKDDGNVGRITSDQRVSLSGQSTRQTASSVDAFVMDESPVSDSRASNSNPV